MLHLIQLDTQSTPYPRLANVCVQAGDWFTGLDFSFA